MTNRLNDMLALVSESRRQFRIKKDASLHVVANATIVYMATGLASSPQLPKKYVRDDIAKAGEDIASTNKKRKEQRERGLACLRGKITADRLKSDGSEDPLADLEYLKGLAQLDDDEFNRGQLVKLKTYTDQEDVPLVPFARWLLQLNLRSDAPFVSRLATVLSGVVPRYIGQSNVSVEQIVEDLKSEGGFESVLYAQREQKSPNKTTASKTRAVSERAVESSPPSVQSESAFHSETLTVTMRLPSGVTELPNGLVSLHAIIRRREDIEVVAFQPLTQAEFDEAKAKYGPALRGPAQIIDAPPVVPADHDNESASGKASS